MYLKRKFLWNFRLFPKKLISHSDISKLISKFYHQIDFRLIFANNFSISSFFNFKDRISPNIKSNIVYNYSCSHCSATYLGESIRHFHTRVSEHKGISPRTGVPYTKAPKSNIYQHYLQTGHEILTSDFKIVSRVVNGKLN